ncbi:MAG: sugar phosphate isomerase/epimerase [Cyclobacteriaceae bacterium]
MTTRRKFIEKSSVLAMGTMIAPLGCTTKPASKEQTSMNTQPSTPVKPKDMGMQAYSVREALDKDFAGSMKKIADIGYKYIEAYGMGLDGKLFNMPPAEYKKIVNDLGMELLSTHATYFTPDQAQAVIDASSEAGLKYLVIPYLEEQYRQDYYKIAENLNAVGELFKNTGIKFCYHNHDFEFETVNDEVALDVMIRETDPELVSFEADLYWIKKGGYDPMEYLKKFPGRFSLYHVKDAKPDLSQTTVGEGTLDFEALINAKDMVGMDYYFVEDERTDDPFGNLQKAFDHMNTLEI